MVFVTIYKKSHVFKEGENPIGTGDLVLVFHHDRKVIKTVDGNVCSIETFMDEKPFMFIPLIDDGIDECTYIPQDIPPEDMLFIEHLLPKWYYIYNEFRNITSESIEKFLSENLYVLVENIVNQNELFEHVVETLCKSKVLLDGDEYHKKLLSMIENFEQYGITFLPEDPIISEITKKMFSS